MKQGPQLSPDQFAEYRRALSDRLARAEREEKSMRRIVYVTCGLIGAVYLALFGMWINHLEDAQGALASYLMVAFILMPVFFVFFLLLYFLKYRPRLRDARQEEQRALLLDLQGQLNELRDKLPPSEV